MSKHCELCGGEKSKKAKRFCSSKCYGQWMMNQNLSPTHHASRKRAQRHIISLRQCEDCGSTGVRLTRHHPDHGDALRVEILCYKCHAKADLRDGFRKARKRKDCAICGKVFTPSHSKKHKTCSPECLSEIGRSNAMKRWGRSTFQSETEPTDSRPSETP